MTFRSDILLMEFRNGIQLVTFRTDIPVLRVVELKSVVSYFVSETNLFQLD